MMTSRSTLRPYVWMLAGSVAFSWMGILARVVASHEEHPIAWQVVAMFRSAIPLVLIGAWAIAASVPLVFWGPRILWMRSLAGSCSLIGTFYCLTQTDLHVSDVFTLTNMFPVWVALLAWPMLGKFPSAKVWLSVACGAAGVILIQRPHFAKGEFAALLAVSVSLFTALAMIGLHRLQKLDTRAVVVHFSATALMFAAAAYFLFPHRHTDLHLPPRLWGELFALGLCATIGQVCLTKAFTTGDPAKISVVGLTQIVFTLTLDALWLGHALDPMHLLGIPLVIGPTAWLMLRHHPAPGTQYSDEPIETTPNISE